jgi:MFS family permease
MMKELGVDAGLMGIALSAFFWCYLVMNIPAGGLADRYGTRRTLGWAASLWSVCSALTGSATHYLHIIPARIGVGAGEAASFPVNARLITNNFERQERGTAMGLYISGLRLGFAVTPVLMAWLISTWGWRRARSRCTSMPSGESPLHPGPPGAPELPVLPVDQHLERLFPHVILPHSVITSSSARRGSTALRAAFALVDAAVRVAVEMVVWIE